MSFALPTFAQQKDTVDPKVEQQIRALVVRPATIRQRTGYPRRQTIPNPPERNK